MMDSEIRQKKKIKRKKFCQDIYKDRYIYLLLLPSIILIAVFSYAPLPGIRIAFQNYNISKPVASEWVWFDNFIEIFKYGDCLKAVTNTFYISIVLLFITFPAPIIFALLINEITHTGLKKTVQTISYLPHFLSWISVIGIVTSLYAKSGIVNDFIAMFGGERMLLLAEPGFLVTNVVILNLWKGIGWGSIIFLAAITGVDQALFEAATLDGANRFKQVIYVTIPTIMPTVIIMLIWRLGSLFSDNFELMYGLQNAFVQFEVISTWIYKNGIEGGNYKLSTAFGLLQGVINFIFLFAANQIAKKLTDSSVF